MRILPGTRRILAILCLTLLGVFPSRAREPGTRESVLEEIRGMGARRENSPGERALLEFLESEASRRSLEAVSVPVSDFSDTHSFSRILEVRVPGKGPGVLALLVPVFDGFSWGDGAEGIAAALELLDRLAGSPPPLEVRLAFLGADEDLAGSRAYAAYCADEASLAALRLEAAGARPETAEILIGGTGILSPFWFLDATVRAVRTRGLRDEVRANRSMIQRLGLTDDRSPLDPWFLRDIPAITLRLGSSEPGGSGPDPGVLVLETLVRSLGTGIPDTWDRQYVLFEAGGFRIAVRETLYVASILGLFSVLGLIFVFDSLRNRELLSKELGRVPRGASALLVVCLALYACVLVADLFQDLLLKAAGSPDFWKVHPVPFTVLRMGQILTLFTALSSLCARFGLLPRKAEFFRGSAVVVLGMDVLLVSSLRLPLSLPFLWAFVIALIGRRFGRALERSWPTALALPLVLTPLGILAADLARDPEFAAFERFLLPGFGGAVYLVFIALPFLLIFVGLGEGLFGAGFYRVRTSWIAGSACLALTAAGGGWLAADARGYRGSTEISVREYSDEDTGAARLEIASFRPLPAFNLARGEDRVAGAGGESTETLGPLPAEPRIRVSVARKPFLDRVQLDLSIRTEGEPDSIRIRILGMTKGSVYDASFPVRPTEDGAGIVISIGARPPNPVEVSLTVSGDFLAEAEVAAEFRSPSTPLLPEGPVTLRDYRQESRRTVILRGGRDPVL